MRPIGARDPWQVGLAGLLGLALVAGAVLLLSVVDPGARSYSAVLAHTGGIRAGEEVQVAGVGVGEVTDVALGEDHVVVRFTVEDDIRLGARTTVEVKVATLLGTHFLMVDPDGGGTLPDGRVPLAQTRVPYNLQDVLDDAVPELRAFDAALLERSLGEIATVLERGGGELGPALTGVGDLSRVVAERSDDIGALLAASRRVAGQLADSSGDLVELMRQAELILDVLRSRRETIHALLRDLERFARHLGGLVEDTRADVGPTLRDLERVIGVLEAHDASLDRALAVLAPASRYFANAGGTGPWLDQLAPGATPDNLGCRQEGSCG